MRFCPGMHLSRRLLLGLAGATLGPRLVRAAPAPAAPAAPLIGAALPLSGAAALIGDEVWRGIQLAADAVNAEGGIAGAPVSLAAADMPDPARASAAVNGLINASHATVLLGCGTSGLSYPASAAAELAQTPLIELTALADGILQRGFKFSLRTGPATGMAAALAAQAIARRFPGARLGLLYNTGAGGGALAAAAAPALAAAGLTVTRAIGYPEGVADLHDQVGQLMRARIDVLLHAAGLDDALGFALAAQAQGWRPSGLVGCGAGYEYRETQAALGDALEGVFVIAPPGWASAPKDLTAAYQGRFGVGPRAADSLTAYAGAKLVFETLNGAGGDATRLLAALRRTSLPKGALANGFGVSFDHTGQNTGAFVTLQQWRAAGLLPVAG